MNRMIRVLLGAALTVAVWGTVQAAEPLSPEIERVYNDLRGRPIRGYDPVAYFTEGKPMEGSDEFTHEWNGGVWRFASAEHRDLFAAEPEKYAPQYGGYCAYAASLGYAETVDPTKWKIHEGKLYLNDPSAYERWLKDIPGYITQGDKNWQEKVLSAKAQ